VGGDARVALADLLEAVKVTTDILISARIDFALCGGIAVYARGGIPTDHDVDVVIQSEDAQRALDALSEAGLRTESPPEGWLVKAYHEDVLIDLIYRPVDRPVTAATLADVDQLPVGPVRLPVLSASELLIHSLGTLNDQECDFSDPLRLARAIREQIDVERVRAETKDSPYARAFLVLAEELNILPGGNHAR
jgi:hypothetical protein